MDNYIDNEVRDYIIPKDIKEALNNTRIIETSRKNIIQELDEKKDPQLPRETSTLIADFVMKKSSEPVSLTMINEPNF
ncbi:hypothetical protein [Piscirickettsia salmonis]|uniref:hypothetical protein n=1 Tax=Piscirickettsia salmonis TaxID=1238 RepID=UPI0007C88250|nr:hypothetical protein A0O36_02845 [Piscirickettsiaceae bacterium NZ-RLO1]